MDFERLVLRVGQYMLAFLIAWGAVGLCEDRLEAAPATVDDSAPARMAGESRSSAVSAVGRSSCPVTIASRANQKISYASELAGRGASYAARAELIGALKSVVQTLDAEQGSQAHSRAMEAGLTALREAADFTAHGQTSTVSVDVSHVAIGHRTPVLRNLPADELTPAGALQAYYRYATDQLTVAGGHEPIASRVLYGLARLESDPSSGSSQSIAGANAIALHRAALGINPRNYQSANELAVLEARFGRLEEAKALLVHSLEISPSCEGWHNLSVVYEKLGERKAAQAAREWYELLKSRTGQNDPTQIGQGAAIYWVDAKKFAENSQPETEALVARAPTAPTAPAAAPATSSPMDPLTKWLGFKRKD